MIATERVPVVATKEATETVPMEDDWAGLGPLTARGGGSPSLGELVRVSVESLLANRLRSLLTVLGVIIGVASIVALLALGAGVSAAITGQVQGLGTNLLTIMPATPGNRGPDDHGGSPTLTIADANAIAALQLPVSAVAPEFTGSAEIVAPAAHATAMVVGVTPASQQTGSLTLATGSFVDAGQVRSASSVAVLGANLATTLFGKGPALGQTVRVNGQALRVVGVLAAKGGNAFGSVDDRVLVPLTLAQQQLFDGHTPDGNSYRVSSISLAATDSADLTSLQSRLYLTLRDRHHLAADGTSDDFTVINQKAALSTLSTITTVLSVFLGAIAGISLVVGGIGIMNIMLVSVTERTREIGLRKAVGAQGRDILLQFVAEALVISLLGGLIGLALGGGLALAVSLSGVFTAPISPSSVVIAVGFSLAVGLFFGIYPARRAASTPRSGSSGSPESPRRSRAAGRPGSARADHADPRAPAGRPDRQRSGLGAGRVGARLVAPDYDQRRAARSGRPRLAAGRRASRLSDRSGGPGQRRPAQRGDGGRAPSRLDRRRAHAHRHR